MKCKSFCVSFILFVNSYALASQKIVSYADCESKQLHVVLNKGNAATKKDLILGLQALTSYWELKAVAQPSSNSELHFIVSAAYCEAGVDGAESCPEPQSWGELQWRLKTIKSARVSCHYNESQSQEEEQETLPDKTGGGVTGQNGD